MVLISEPTAKSGERWVPVSEALVAQAGEVPSDPFIDLKFKIHERLIKELDLQKVGGKDPSSLRPSVESAAGMMLMNEEVPLSRQERSRLSVEIADEVCGLGPLEPLLQDSSITEVLVNRPNQVYVERKGKLCLSSKVFKDNHHIMRMIDKIIGPLGRHIDEASPMVDARLADGSRVHVIIPPLALDSPVISIRKFSRDALTMDDLINLGTFTPELAELLRACVEGKVNIVVSGGTGTGKTTVLNVLSSFIPRGERVITIEDPAELQLQQPHVVRLETRPSNTEGRGAVLQRDLVRNALRMRPDRIIVGEVRGGEAFDMLQAMNTGHEGSLTTVHANSPRDALARIENMVLMAGMDLPAKAIREQVSSAIHLVIQLKRLMDGSRHVVQITEIAGMEGEIITVQDVFEFRYAKTSDGARTGALVPSGLRPKVAEQLEARGITLPPGIFTPAGGSIWT
ncbi:MAG: CpaF family protein [Chloroflexi bacterium]|nr:CpaF family protein [Chloroflexota bacterium]